MSENGTILWTFHNVDEAQKVCKEWYRIQDGDVSYWLEESYLEEDFYSGENDFDPASASCAVA